MTAKRLHALAFLFATLIALAGCGGDSSSPTAAIPTITAQPASQTVTAGGAVTFSVSATGGVPMTYQWYKSSLPIPDATTSRYVIASAVTADAGTYRVAVINSGGVTESSDAILTVDGVDGSPTISTEPSSQTVTAGSPVTFQVSASGSGTLTYQWYNASGPIAGATSPSYTIASTAVGDAGTYHVTVTNSAGTTTSTDATLTVNSPTVTPPVIISQPTSQTVTAGSAVTFVVSATGTGTLTYQWYKGATAIAGATSSSYGIASTIVSDSGSYYVTVSNISGPTQSAAAILTVNGQTVTCDSTYLGNVMSAITAYKTALGAPLSAALQYDTSANTSAQLNAYKTRWSNLPQPQGYSRPGIALSQMTTSAQIQAFNTLASTALSAQGYLDLKGVLAADDYLGYTRLASGYGAELYRVAVVGTPSTSGLWTLMFGGHNLAFSLTFNGGCLYPTPHYIGAEPRTRFAANNHYTLTKLAAVYTAGNYTPLEDKGNATLAIFSGMNNATLQSAFLTGQKFTDVLIGPVEGGTGNFATVKAKFDAIAASSTRGALVSSLPAKVQESVTAAIQEFIGDYDAGTASRLLADYTGAYATTYVAWGNASGTFATAGPSATTNGSYMRIDGPRVWIEISVQNAVVMPNQTSFQMMYRDKTYDYYNELAN